MASTITLQSSIFFALPFIKGQPLTIYTTNEPAISAGNVVKQTMLGPPFIWRWNRATDSSTSTASGTQDYTVALSTFGFLEKATITDSTGKVTELEIKLVLSADTAATGNTSRPNYISVQSDDNAGNILFRLMPVPDAVYTLTLVFQKAAVLFAALTDTWTPIPDYLSYIYQRGFLAFALELKDDPRWSAEHTRFLASLLGASEGLSESEKNIFLGNLLNSGAQMQNAQLRTQQATQARGT
jgi:hypothetical protein